MVLKDADTQYSIRAPFQPYLKVVWGSAVNSVISVNYAAEI